MATIKKDLQTLTKEIKALSTKLDKLTKAAAKLGKAKPAAKKPVAKKKAVKKPAAKKKAAVKKAGGATSINKVVGFIQRAGAGLDTAALEKKTGFNKKKVQNIIYKLKKQGKIKTKAKGIYIKA